MGIERWGDSQRDRDALDRHLTDEDYYRSSRRFDGDDFPPPSGISRAKDWLLAPTSIRLRRIEAAFVGLAIGNLIVDGIVFLSGIAYNLVTG